MKAPMTIYLQVCGDCQDRSSCDSCDFKDLADNVTWCAEKIFKGDIAYIRKDLYDKLKRELESYKHPGFCDMQQEGL